MKVLITGGAGFIGSALAERLAAGGDEVLSIDNLNHYYDPTLKRDRLKRGGVILTEGDEDLATQQREYQSRKYPTLKFRKADICNSDEMEEIFASFRPEVVMNLAAQAGVRYSIENPRAYVQTNVMGFVNLLECASRYPVLHFVYASSSSVYGGNTNTPFSETDRVDNPVSVYAATKKSNELLASAYHSLYGIPVTGLRFFTVYGSWGRPDMAPMLFAGNISKGSPIKVFNNGDMSRDFTHISDIVEGIERVIHVIPSAQRAPKVYNIGAGHPESLERFITILENLLEKKAIKEYLPMQKGDVKVTYADTASLAADYGYTPGMNLEDGLREFIGWYKEYYK